MEPQLFDSVIFKYFYNLRNIEVAQEELSEAKKNLIQISSKGGFISSKTMDEIIYKDVKIAKFEKEIEYLNSAIDLEKEQIIEFLRSTQGHEIEIADTNGVLYRITLGQEPDTENILKIYTEQPVKLI